ncbi:MAG: hypothetical protein ACTS22_04820 [Phycisphaerales bacterium]
MTSTTRPKSRVLLTACLLGSAAALPGCNIVAPIFFIVAGPDKIPAAYKLDEDRSTVVFVDDPRNEMPRRALRVSLLEAVEDELLNRGLVETVVGGQAALRVADNDASAGKMSVTEIGRAVNAEVVIWITIDGFARADMARNVEPTIQFRVRVVDATNDTMLFPSGGGVGQRVTVRETVRRGAVASSSGAQSSAELAIADKAGRSAAQLFYSHPVNDRIAERAP